MGVHTVILIDLIWHRMKNHHRPTRYRNGTASITVANQKDLTIGNCVNGLSLIGKLRQELGRKLPALLLTADRDRSLQERAVAANVGFMNKPVRPAALRATVSRARTQAQAAE